MDAVLSGLGPRKNAADQVALFGDALARICEAMEQHGVRRVVSISGAGTVLPGEHVDFGRKAVRAIMKIVSRHVLESKQREAEVILAVDPEWVLARPPRLLDGPPSGAPRVTLDKPASSKVTVGDVAAFMLEAAEGDAWVRKAPFVAAP